MTAIEPSFLAKFRRAEKHLKELEAAINAYAARHPYTMRTGFESKKKPAVTRLHFTAYPSNTDIPIIAADAIYNIRSGLDHLMAALVPANRQRKVYFPIAFQGVWDDPVPGENKERANARQRWCTAITGVKPQAVAILQRLQPNDGARDDDPTIHFLSALNRLAVVDRHVRLPLVAPTLIHYTVTVTRADGATSTGWGDVPGALEDGAEVTGLPAGIVDVQVQGTPVVAVEVGGPGSYLRLPDALRSGLAETRKQVISPLAPFLRR